MQNLDWQIALEDEKGNRLVVSYLDDEGLALKAVRKLQDALTGVVVVRRVWLRKRTQAGNYTDRVGF